MGDYVVVNENTPEPQGYVIPLIPDGLRERSFVHLFGRAFVEHFGPVNFGRDINFVVDCAAVVKARMEQLRCDTVKVYFAESTGDGYVCMCIFYLAQFPESLRFDIFDF
jgi:hypothetical protein